MGRGAPRPFAALSINERIDITDKRRFVMESLEYREVVNAEQWHRRRQERRRKQLETARNYILSQRGINQ